MSYPGQGGRTYGGYAPPSHSGYTAGYDANGNLYGAPPPGPPQGYGYGQPQGGYGRPPPQQYNSGYGGNYGPPQGPPPGAYNNARYQGQPGQGGPGYQAHGTQYGRPSAPQGDNPNAYNHYNRNGNVQLPPSTPQSFGAGKNYNFQYSNCTGKRKALLIGINYIGSSNALKGCINDARAVAAFLKDRYGYRDDDMVILTDDARNPRSLPTKQNILQAMQWLVNGAETNDTLFLHYSGHGGQTEDLDGDEDDGYDEVIYPVDFKVAGHIVDDQIHDILVRPLKPGVRLTALFDCCHSGSVLDLPYIYSTKGVLKEPNLAKEAGMGLLGAVTSYSRGDIGGVISSFSSVFKQATVGNSGYERTKRTKTSPADVVLISGCKDSQTRYVLSPLPEIHTKH